MIKKNKVHFISRNAYSSETLMSCAERSLNVQGWFMKMSLNSRVAKLFLVKRAVDSLLYFHYLSEARSSC